ncbi:hypothetical protein ACLB2K_007513 [Fragaria x ananassa]
MGVHVDESLNAQSRGIYTFRAQGSIYHKIGGLLPNKGARPRYLQAYIYDTEHELDNRMSESVVLDRGLVEKIQHILNLYNPFVHQFRSLGRRQDLPNCRLIIKEQPSNQRQYSLPSASQVAAVIVGAADINPKPRDLIVQTISGRLWNVKDSVGYYDLMQYPLLLPYGTYRCALVIKIPYFEADAFCNSNVCRRTILPSTFVRSPRDMYQRYQDAMALVQKYGRQDLFITMTCNPNWEEIKSELLPGQTSQDRPDLEVRVFHSKLERLKEDIINKGVLGRVVAHAFVVEFQKRGLPHVHMLVMLDEHDKLNNPEDYDRIVRAEIPDKDEEPRLYDLVLRHMIHGPCGPLNQQSSSLRRLFVTILVYSQPTGVRRLWDEFHPFMAEDYSNSSGMVDSSVRNKLLRDLNRMLEQFDKSIKDFDLPEMTNEQEDGLGVLRCIEDELSVNVPQEDIEAIGRLNNDQMIAFNTILDAVMRKETALFFVDGPGGTGKTYLYRALLAKLRSMNHIVLATASSGIATTILPGGRIAHSRFKIPLDVKDQHPCVP